MGTQDLASFIVWLIEEGKLPRDVANSIQAGALDELAERGKTIQTEQDRDEMWVRWIEQRIHEELNWVANVLGSPLWYSHWPG